MNIWAHVSDLGPGPSIFIGDVRILNSLVPTNKLSYGRRCIPINR
jgi:hypothetical protein